LKATGSEEISPDLAERLLRITGGNAFFLAEVVAGSPNDLSQIDPGADGSTSVQVPPAIARLFDQKLTKLKEEDRALLQAAAVSGVDFPADGIASLVGREIEDVEDALHRIGEVVGIIRPGGVSELPDGTITARFRFEHALLQAYLYGRIPPATRMRLHRKYADRGEEAYADAPERVAAEIAEHRERAGDHAGASRSWLIAANGAARKHAHSEAKHAILRGLQSAKRAEAPPATMYTLQDTLGRIHRSAGDMAAAASAFSTAAELAKEGQNLADEVKAHLMRGSALSWIDRNAAIAAIDTATAGCERLPDSQKSSDDRVGDDVVHARGACGYWHLLLSGYREQDRTACLAALDAAQRSGRDDLALAPTVRLSFFESLRSRYEQAAEYAFDGERLARSQADGFEFLLARYFAAWSLLHLGEWGRLLSLLRETQDLARRCGHEPWACLFTMQEGWLFEHIGDLDRAAELCRAGRSEAERLDHSFGRLVGGALLSYVHLAKGDGKQAGEEIERALTFIDERPVLMDWIWKIHLIHGRSEVALLAGDLDAAEADARETIQLAGVPDERVYLALASRRLAEIDLARDNLDSAGENLQRALSALDGVRIPFAAYRVHDTAARYAARRGETTAETAALEARQKNVELLAASLVDHPEERARFLSNADSA